jgi:hypothetical protein
MGCAPQAVPTPFDTRHAELAGLLPMLEAASSRPTFTVDYTTRCRGCGQVVHAGGTIERAVTCAACDEAEELLP